MRHASDKKPTYERPRTVVLRLSHTVSIMQTSDYKAKRSGYGTATSYEWD